MKLLRVFPRKTRLSPTDQNAYFDVPDMFVEGDAVHVSCLFTWDKSHAEFLAEQWCRVAPVSIGGPAYNKPGADFVPGKYVRAGGVITSRGCPNKCWFCSVWKSESGLTELPITDGWNLLDDNILACSENHIRKVFAMLKRQKVRAEFTGGLEAARLKEWHVELLTDLRPKQMFFAYDTPDDYEPLVSASKMLREAGFNRQSLRCYVLIGGPRDTLKLAESRMRQSVRLGFFPMAMLWRNSKGDTDISWRQFQRQWARPALIYRNCAQEINEALKTSPNRQRGEMWVWKMRPVFT